MVEGIAVRCPGSGAAGEGGGGDAVVGKGFAVVLGAGAGGAGDEDVSALGCVADVGEGPVEVVEGDVEGAGEVAGGVLAGGADVQDDQFMQAGAGLVGVEGAGVVMRRCSVLVVGGARLWTPSYPGGYWREGGGGAPLRVTGGKVSGRRR